MHGSDGETIAHLFERDVGAGLHLLGSELGLAEDQRQRHGEAGGMRRANEFLRVRTRLALKAAGEAIWIVFERAAFGRDRALAVLDAALPFGRSGCRRHYEAPCVVRGSPIRWPTPHHGE